MPEGKSYGRSKAGVESMEKVPTGAPPFCGKLSMYTLNPFSSQRKPQVCHWW